MSTPCCIPSPHLPQHPHTIADGVLLLLLRDSCLIHSRPSSLFPSAWAAKNAIRRGDEDGLPGGVACSWLVARSRNSINIRPKLCNRVCSCSTRACCKSGCPYRRSRVGGRRCCSASARIAYWIAAACVMMVVSCHHFYSSRRGVLLKPTTPIHYAYLESPPEKPKGPVVVTVGIGNVCLVTVCIKISGFME